MIPVPVLEPVLPPADQSFPDSDQENIPPRMVTPPPLNVLVPVEEEIRVKECCQQTLAVRNQRAVHGRGAITKPFRPSGQKQLASVSKIVATLQDSCEQRRRVRRLQRGLGGVTNWHFSRSFRFIFLHIYEHYPSDSNLSSSPHSFKPISPAYSVHR